MTVIARQVRIFLEKRRPGRNMKILELKLPPLVQFLLAGSAMWLLSYFAPQHSFAVPGSRIVAVSLACLGLLIGLAGIVAFRAARTTVDPRFPDKATAIVTVGVYQWTRNPMYLGLLGILSGWGVFLGNFLSLACLPAFVLYMNRFQIGPEERAMDSIFGNAYRAYKNSVRRWI